MIAGTRPILARNPSGKKLFQEAEDDREPQYNHRYESPSLVGERGGIFAKNGLDVSSPMSEEEPRFQL